MATALRQARSISPAFKDGAGTLLRMRRRCADARGRSGRATLWPGRHGFLTLPRQVRGKRNVGPVASAAMGRTSLAPSTQIRVLPDAHTGPSFPLARPRSPRLRGHRPAGLGARAGGPRSGRMGTGLRRPRRPAGAALAHADPVAPDHRGHRADGGALQGNRRPRRLAAGLRRRQAAGRRARPGRHGAAPAPRRDGRPRPGVGFGRHGRRLRFLRRGRREALPGPARPQPDRRHEHGDAAGHERARRRAPAPARGQRRCACAPIRAISATAS